MYRTYVPLLFNFYRGEIKLQKSEISEDTYVKLKLPALVTIIGTLITLTFSVAFFYFGLKISVDSNENDIQERVTIYDYKQDRKLDSISNTIYRREMQQKMNTVINKLEILTNSKYKDSFLDEN